MSISEAIQQRLEKLEWLHQSFQKQQYTSISELEKALFKEKLIQLYDIIESVQSDSSSVQSKEEPIQEERKIIVEENQSQIPKKNEESKPKKVENPNQDLRKIIDLNKSFVYKSELFQNDTKAYNACIDALNKTHSYEEAHNVIESMAQSKEWNTDSKVYELFMSTVEKRFQPIV